MSTYDGTASSFLNFSVYYLDVYTCNFLRKHIGMVRYCNSMPGYSLNFMRVSSIRFAIDGDWKA